MYECGVVQKISGKEITIKCGTNSTCAACKSPICKKKDRIFDVRNTHGYQLEVGDEVEVLLKASMGFKAVYLAYLIPLVILLAAILGLMAVGVGEVVAGLSGLAAVGAYYLLLWLFRGKLQNEYVFTIKR